MRPAELFGRALDSGAQQLTVRDSAGDAWPMAMGRWLAAVDAVDERVLLRAHGPVLDVGCGPGRHVHALSERGVEAVGVELAPVAVRHARDRGARVVEGSIFDVAPSPGAWSTALLLDGNIGIGGCPAVLLQRVAELLRPDGRVLVEVEPAPREAPPRDDPALHDPLASAGQLRVRIEAGGSASSWFPWARVTAAAIAAPAAAAGLCVVERWSDGGRHFCSLARP